MTSFIVFPEHAVKNLTSPVPYVLISIRSRDRNEGVKLLEDFNRKAVLFIAFDDCSLNERRVAKPILKREARQIWKFFDEWKNKVSLIIIQCEAGISRSAGVCAALMQDSGIRPDYAYEYPRLPNAYVKSVMLRVRRNSPNSL